MSLGVIFFLTLMVATPTELSASHALSAKAWNETARYLKEIERREGFLPKVKGLMPNLTVEDAYKIQSSFIQVMNQGAVIAGYKAGFTGASGREKFELQHPVSGVLFEGCGYESGTMITLSEHPGLMLEMEIGFRLKKRLKNRLEKVEDLKSLVGHALPVIELPHLKFKDLVGITGIDLVSTNMASACWIEGTPLTDLTPMGYDELEVLLYRDGDLIDSGLAGAVNGQRQALVWLINHLLDRNIELHEGLLLLTGKIGKINPAQTGKYRAIYGEKEMLFEIQP